MKLLQHFLSSFDSIDKDFLKSIEFKCASAIPIAAFILLPLSLIKDMSGFRHVSFASIISLFYLGVVLLVELPSYAA